jgi:hypothetical protein
VKSTEVHYVTRGGGETATSIEEKAKLGNARQS